MTKGEAELYDRRIEKRGGEGTRHCFRSTSGCGRGEEKTMNALEGDKKGKARTQRGTDLEQKKGSQEEGGKQTVSSWKDG